MISRKSRRKAPPSRRHWSAVDRVIFGVDAFRRGEPVLIGSGRSARLVFAIETLVPSQLGALRAKRAPLHLALTHARARTLKIRLYTEKAVAVVIRPEMDLSLLRMIADPTEDLESPLKGPFETVRVGLSPAYAAGIALAKLAGLLPAVLVTSRQDWRGVHLSSHEIEDYNLQAAKSLTQVTRARVPLKGAERTELVAFRARDGGPEHYAIVIGTPVPRDPVLVRMHSECFTGDLLGSLKCDCGEQLRGAVDLMAKAGSGILLYLAQEGRGIGLINKLRAYRLQDQGFDTVAANERLGFEPDERSYDIAARMLELLGFSRVRLLTNNPEKVRRLKAAGVKVVERVPHRFAPNPHNRLYLKTKAEKAGHLL
ncbi:MAG: GTP cyclohydrolase II [Alphaproteobacteria bacterium]|nr:GTP cyclohydrolase II [Alphaproteobacteria bacterium]